MLAGCAASVDDPLPEPKPAPDAKDPPAETFSGKLEHQGSIYDYIIPTGNTGDVPVLEKQQPPGIVPGH
ncbi:MAG TPA: hypothetical protein VIF62_25780 [Labilithrix sp.]